MEPYVMQLTVSEFEHSIRRIVTETIRENQAVSKEPIHPEYLTRQQVKEKLHVSLPTLNRFDKEGILSARKIGGRVLYLWSDVEKAINQEQNIKYKRSRHVR